jgi:hypothetical protein
MSLRAIFAKQSQFKLKIHPPKNGAGQIATPQENICGSQ